MRILLVLLCCFLGVASCKKEKESVAHALVGSWRLYSFFEDNGGAPCFCWRQVNPMAAPKMHFTKEGSFSVELPPISSMAGCSGNYRVENDSVIAFTSICQSAVERTERHYYKLSKDTLLIEFPLSGTTRISKYIKE